jgi:hypothetical protein
MHVDEVYEAEEDDEVRWCTACLPPFHSPLTLTTLTVTLTTLTITLTTLTLTHPPTHTHTHIPAG